RWIWDSARCRAASRALASLASWGVLIGGCSSASSYVCSSGTLGGGSDRTPACLGRCDGTTHERSESRAGVWRFGGGARHLPARHRPRRAVLEAARDPVATEDAAEPARRA